MLSILIQLQSKGRYDCIGSENRKTSLLCRCINVVKIRDRMSMCVSSIGKEV